ncbi:MAG TPA: TIGR03118 family protein, partial [Chitinophagaceae bacterium]
MKKVFVKTGNLYWVIACLLLVATGCQKNIEKPATLPTDANAQSAGRLKIDFQQVNIVSDTSEFNPMRIDPNLINAWGIAFAPSPIGPPWVNANGTGLSNIFNVSTGADLIPPVAIPSPGNPMGGGAPTGIVFNGSSGFRLPNGKPARFIFDTEDGFIAGWNGGTVAITAKDNSATAIYKGLAIAADGTDSFIYAVNFKAKRIDVYDTSWTQVNNKSFNDPSVPSDYSPFNIQNINNNLVVTFAKTVPGSRDEAHGPSLGFVDIFRSDGTLLTNLAKRGVLNAPWGIAMAPASWANMQWDGDASDDDNGTKNHSNEVTSVFLIGNFGDGRINAFNQDGQFLGRLRSGKKAIVIDGLWALSFAPATATAINPNWLFFTAGPG